MRVNETPQCFRLRVGCVSSSRGGHLARAGVKILCAHQTPVCVQLDEGGRCVWRRDVMWAAQWSTSPGVQLGRRCRSRAAALLGGR